MGYIFAQRVRKREHLPVEDGVFLRKEGNVSWSRENTAKRTGVGVVFHGEDDGVPVQSLNIELEVNE